MIKEILYNPWVVLTLATLLVTFLSLLFNKWYDKWLFKHRTKEHKAFMAVSRHFE